MRKRRISALFAAPVACAALVAMTAPALAAWTCPGCYGFVRVGTRVYVGDGDAGRILGLGADIAAAKARVDSYFEGSKAAPTLLVCFSQTCDRRIGGRGAKATTYGALMIRVAPGGANETILTHELAHAALHDRIGALAQWRETVPAWFNEGLAVIVSRDARYLRADGSAYETCDIGALPAGSSEWAWRARDEHAALYRDAACAAAAWIAAHGGREGVLRALDGVAKGEDFPA